MSAGFNIAVTVVVTRGDDVETHTFTAEEAAFRYGDGDNYPVPEQVVLDGISAYSK